LRKVYVYENHTIASSSPRIFSARDNLYKAEKFGFIASADAWMEMRRLRNQMVHEYIEFMVVLSNALNSGHSFVLALVTAAKRCVAEAQRLLAA
jgi:hypothetical protein